MMVNWQGRSRRSLRGVLATAALVGAYLVATLGVSSVTMTAGSAPAYAKAKKKSSGGSGGRSKGSRGRRGRGCSVVLQVLDVC